MAAKFAELFIKTYRRQPFLKMEANTLGKEKWIKTGQQTKTLNPIEFWAIQKKKNLGLIFPSATSSVTHPLKTSTFPHFSKKIFIFKEHRRDRKRSSEWIKIFLIAKQPFSLLVFLLDSPSFFKILLKGNSGYAHYRETDGDLE